MWQPDEHCVSSHAVSTASHPLGIWPITQLLTEVVGGYETCSEYATNRDLGMNVLILEILHLGKEKELSILIYPRGLLLVKVSHATYQLSIQFLNFNQFARSKIQHHEAQQSGDSNPNFSAPNPC